MPTLSVNASTSARGLEAFSEAVPKHSNFITSGSSMRALRTASRSSIVDACTWSTNVIDAGPLGRKRVAGRPGVQLDAFCSSALGRLEPPAAVDLATETLAAFAAAAAFSCAAAHAEGGTGAGGGAGAAGIAAATTTEGPAAIAGDPGAEVPTRRFGRVSKRERDGR